MAGKWITEADDEVAAAYLEALPRQLGSLHERMQYVIAEAREAELWRTNNALWQGLMDLECEVSYHVPARPPFGKRGVRSTRQGKS